MLLLGRRFGPSCDFSNSNRVDSFLQMAPTEGGIGWLLQGHFSVHVCLISRHQEKDGAAQAVQKPGRRASSVTSEWLEKKKNLTFSTAIK